MQADPVVYPPTWLAAEVADVEAVVRRVLTGRVRSHEDVDDLVQDAFVRLDDARVRLAPRALLPYASIVARNLAHSQGRAVMRESRLAERHANSQREREQEHGPEAVERDDEKNALRLAIETLPNAERVLLVARDVDGVSTGILAAERGTSSGGVRVQLTRIRSKVRLEFLLSSRRIGHLPSRRCRPVLLAVSAGDARRLRATAASGHVAACPTCAELAAVLSTRRRASV